ncbi:MAG TPA: C39 family peptidase [Chthoniobacteraceae bacterium]|nr:C39 family peptidase [Chthoniobacteraceae bacterium]
MIKTLRAMLLFLWLGGGFASLPALAQEQPAPETLPLDEALAPASLWSSDGAQWVEARGELGFHWVSTAKGAAQTTRKGITLYGLPIDQAVVRMEEGKPKQVVVLFYNRGDRGDLPREEYDALVRKAVEVISAATGLKMTPRGRDASSAVRAEGVFWETADTRYLLEYSFTREVKGHGIPFRGEFIRLEITPREAPKSMLEEAFAARETKAPFRGEDHVVRDTATGDVMIEGIPMVDQGEKGYCVVASAERVMRYYGIRTDAHELAQLANSSAAEGTSADAMSKALTALTARLRIRSRTQEKFEIRALLDLIRDYNQLARREKQALIPDPGHYIDVQAVYSRMDSDLLRRARTRSKQGINGFQRDIKRHIDKGVPLLWSLMLGVIPEGGKMRQSIGGHMRLIIGYNEKEGQIIYSDSWGMGHEVKRMPLIDAWAVTTGLSTIEPIGG